jgi:hypothetical protein
MRLIHSAAGSRTTPQFIGKWRAQSFTNLLPI